MIYYYRIHHVLCNPLKNTNVSPPLVACAISDRQGGGLNPVSGGQRQSLLIKLCIRSLTPLCVLSHSIIGRAGPHNAVPVTMVCRCQS